MESVDTTLSNRAFKVVVVSSSGSQLTGGGHSDLLGGLAALRSVSLNLEAKNRSLRNFTSSGNPMAVGSKKAMKCQREFRTLARPGKPSIEILAGSSRGKLPSLTLL